MASILLLFVTACDNDPVVIVDPPDAALAVQLRQSIAPWGVVPIGPMGQENPAQVVLGRALVFDKIMSGNRDVSCATCHPTATHGTDGLSLSIGTGGTGAGAARTLGAGRQFTPRNSPSFLNQGLRPRSLLWDGRLSGMGAGPFTTPVSIPTVPNILAAQAMLPVLNREEMRGDPGNLDVSGNPNELAQLADNQTTQIWAALMTRLLAIPEYVTMFAAAFPGLTPGQLRFEHAATAIAAFLSQSFARYDSPFDRFLNRDDNAMGAAAMRGGIIFFGFRSFCASCHGGPLLGGEAFANTGIPQVGPGTGTAPPLDQGRGDLPNQTFSKFQFRAPALRNVELTAPYMHNGVFPTLESVVRHYGDPVTTLRTYDPMQLAPAVRALYHGDSATVAKVMATLDGRMRIAQNFTEAEKADLVEFLKALTDPAARDLSALAPASVPSGLPVN